jgi:RNA polymerase sigma factor (sigma-70 family)
VGPTLNAVATHVDNELIERCVKGDQAAWKDLVARYERLVYSVALTLCTQSDDASDVFQQVWMELYQHLSDLRRIEALPAWLITVTRRTAYKLISTRRGTEPLDDNFADAKERISHIESEHELERALRQLPDRCRTLIDLLYFNTDEPSYAEIAARLGMPVPSVGPTRARCLEKLRKLLG